MNIYIGNLNYKVKARELREVLEEFGTVNSVKLIKDKATGKSKGFGFVNMPNDLEATNAINGLNESELAGRQMVMRIANSK
jgi:RNA recognition motif-containing protein